MSFTVVVTAEQRAEAPRRAAKNSDVKIRLTSFQLLFLEDEGRRAEREDRGR